MEPIVYRHFQDSDAEGVARMWKESFEAWPPGFFGASEITSETVRLEEKSSGRLFTVLALEADRVVGYCMTSPYGGEPEASYVNLVNVVPDMHGRGIGKTLLLDAVARSAGKGLYRIDLHTWPANIKAVPLYKKAGFFWVPDTNVYMQNYMPFLLGRPEFRDFLEGEDWYSCFRRELLVEQDRETAESGREVFTYRFRRKDKEFLAEFDRNGRILSRMETPVFRAGLEVDEGSEYYVGRCYSVSLTGSGFNAGEAVVSCGQSVECTSSDKGCCTVEPRPERLEKNTYDPDCRLCVKLPADGPELGLGIRGIEEVSLRSQPVIFLSGGTDRVRVDLRKLSDVRSINVRWKVDGREDRKELDLAPAVYQSVELAIPGLDEGVHTLTLQLGDSSYPETVVLVAGPCDILPRVMDTRKSALILGGGKAVRVDRKGGGSSILVPGEDGVPRELGKILICPGPPLVWNSDLPRQTYRLELDEEEVTGWTGWPSRPGMVHRIRVRLDRAGFMETTASVENGSNTAQRVNYRARARWSGEMESGKRLIPLPEGLLVEQVVFNQVPDPSEDFSSETANLGAPWLGTSGKDDSLMVYFPHWKEMEYSMPGVPETEISPGDALESPPVRILHVNGSTDSLLRMADILGWETGNTARRLRFFTHNLEPAMASGSEVTLGHPLYGEREAVISLDGSDIASGKVKSGTSISGALQGEGRVDVGLTLAGRTMSLPVYLAGRDSSAEAEEKGSNGLVISNGRVTASIDPAACGHVYSLLLDGVEYLCSSHPEPGEFAWEKPWFGGILPRVSARGAGPYPLQEHAPEVEEIERECGGLREKGFRLVWQVDHKRYGSLTVAWTVTLLRGVPVLRTVMDCESLAGASLSGQMDVRGFLQPGGSGEDSVLTCERFPALAQGRKHAGAWTEMGKWARVSRGDSFVEGFPLENGILMSEDYGRHGCHLSVYSTHDRKRSMQMLWMFGACEEDEHLAEIFRAHR